MLFFIRRGSTTLLKRLMLQVQNQYWVLLYGIQKRIWQHSDTGGFWRSGNTEDNKKRIKILKYLNRVLRNISDITYADIITPYI